MARLIDRDLAQALQDRILADQKAEKTADMPGDRPDDPRRVEALEAQIAAMEKAVADAEALGERRRQEAESAAKAGRGAGGQDRHPRGSPHQDRG